MKRKINYLAILMLILTLFLSVSCKDNESVLQEETKKEWSAEKQGEVVYVNNGSESFFMNYLLYSTLMNRGGYNAVHNHYISTPSLHFDQSELRSAYNKNSYINSSTSSKPTINSISTPSRFKPITTSPNNYNSTKSSYKSYSTPTKSSYNTVKNYSTPSRSSYSTYKSSSYNSSSKSSYSSPSRSSNYSSSRSYSTPSRSSRR